MPFIDLPQRELELYRSSVADPVDFDSFWAATLSESASRPIDAQFELIDVGLKLVDVYDTSFTGFGGHRVRGWFITPKGVASQLSAVVKFLGYGSGRGFPHEHLLWPTTGRAVIVMDTRGQGAGWARGETADPVGSDPSVAGFLTKGITDPHSYFYRRVFTDAVRAIVAVRTRSDVDPSRVAVAGMSQGGGIALAAAGLVPDIKVAMPDVPFLCDFPRAVRIAARDPYGEIARYLAVRRDMVDRTFRTLSYFDGVNFASRAKGSALFSVGIVDDVCPASTVYAAYNAYAGKKSIESYAFNNHEGGGTFHEGAQVRWLSAQGM